MAVTTLIQPAVTRAAGVAVTNLALVLGLFVPAASAQCGPTPEEGFRMLFDGSPESLESWQQSGAGGMALRDDCTLMTTGGLGLLWYAAESFDSYTLRLDWKLDKVVDNSGVFVGFPQDGSNTHNAAIARGYEVQIDQVGRMDGQPRHYTGAIYDIQGPNRDTRVEGTDSFGWNTFEITVDDPLIIVELNGEVVNEFQSVDIARDLSNGHVGLQNHGGPDTAYFRNVQVKEIEPGSVSGGPGGGDDEEPAPTTGPLESLRNNVGIASGPTDTTANFDGGGYAYSAAALRAGDPVDGYPGVAPGDTIEAGGFEFTWPDVAAGAADNVSAAGQTITVEAADGASKIGFLGSAAGGSASGTVTYNYRFVDDQGVEQHRTASAELGFTDWTRGLLADAPLGVNEEIVLKTRFRHTNNAGAFFFTQPHVFLVTLPLDPDMTLESVTLPNAPQIHLFDVAVT